MEKRLLKKVKKGHHKTFEIMVNTYQNKLFGFIYNLVGNQQIAEDILQETFVKAYKSSHTIDVDKPIGPWLMTIARNTTYDVLRKKKTQIIPLDKEIKVSQEPLDLLIEQERNQLLDQCIHELPEHYRIMLQMKYFEGKSYECIAQSMGLEVNKVRWQLRQARVMLKKKIGQEEVSTCLVK